MPTDLLGVETMDNETQYRYDYTPDWIEYFHRKYGELPRLACFEKTDIEALVSDYRMDLVWDWKTTSRWGDRKNHVYYALYGGNDYLIHCSEYEQKDSIITKKRRYNGHFCDALLFYNPKSLPRILTEIEDYQAIHFKTPIKKNTISLLCFSHTYYLQLTNILGFEDLNLELNYGSEFLRVHKLITNFLHSPKCGLCLLHGEVGSGKTTYIKHLLSVATQEVVYIPCHLMSRIADPDFLSFMTNHPDSLLVIEDAEDVVRDRETNNNPSVVANLLNLSDGVLGEILKTKVICTFNTEISCIDKAITRKGRLAVQWEFKKLDVNDSNKLLLHLGKTYKTTVPMTLAEIYNIDYDNLAKREQKGHVGFK